MLCGINHWGYFHFSFSQSLFLLLKVQQWTGISAPSTRPLLPLTPSPIGFLLDPKPFPFLVLIQIYKGLRTEKDIWGYPFTSISGENCGAEQVFSVSRIRKLRKWAEDRTRWPEIGQGEQLCTMESAEVLYAHITAWTAQELTLDLSEQRVLCHFQVRERSRRKQPLLANQKEKLIPVAIWFVLFRVNQTAIPSWPLVNQGIPECTHAHSVMPEWISLITESYFPTPDFP